MRNFNRTPEFAKEFKKLEKKFRSLESDIKSLEEILLAEATGVGKNFTILHDKDGVQIVKVRVACRSLKNRSLRLIYAYQNKTLHFMYIEIYAKSNKENEDKERIQSYLNSLNNKM
jgi:mRNA-degrading endonuclease RelE of RelBE toxin-antitoxin system